MKDMVDEVHLGGSMPTLPTTVAISLAAALAVHMISSLIRQRQKMGGKGPHKDKRSAQHSIPIAPGPIPILGHALKYKDDPPGFLEYACRHVTSTMKLEETNESSSNGDEKNSDVPPPIFKINLAGKEMIIVARDCPALRQIANSPESKCSARQAVADVGFEQTLGYNNVHVGTDVHKRIIKSVLFEGKSQWEPMEVPLVFESVQHAFREELRRLQVKQPKCNTNIGTIKVPDLFHFVRRILLRVTMERFVGREAVLEPNLLEEFMTFQDALEDATAQAAVLPRPIALVAFLWPVQRKRLALQRRIANVLRKYYCKADSDTETPTSTNADNTDGTTRIGFWLQEILNEGKHSIEDISEYIVGLLFAAHKNPAIGAAQAYLFLFERGTSQDQTSCKEEAYNVCQLATLKTSSKSITASKLKESCPRLHQVCLETLRLTGHTIGGLRTARDDIPLSTGSFDVRQGRSRDNFQDSKDGGGCPYYEIHKGQTIGLSHSSMNCDPTTWGDRPLEFDTQRDPALYDNDYAFTTFSHGVHRCPGQSYALAMMVCTLVQLLTGICIGNVDGEYIETSDTSELSPSTSSSSGKFNLQLGIKDLPRVSFERATLAQRDGPVPIIFGT